MIRGLLWSYLLNRVKIRRYFGYISGREDEEEEEDNKSFKIWDKWWPDYVFASRLVAWLGHWVVEFKEV